jgi:hypothetical protein
VTCSRSVVSMVFIIAELALNNDHSFTHSLCSLHLGHYWNKLTKEDHKGIFVLVEICSNIILEQFWQTDSTNDEVHFVLDQHAELDFYSASSLKQQSASRHVAPLGHNILISSQPICAISP